MAGTSPAMTFNMTGSQPKHAAKLPKATKAMLARCAVSFTLTLGGVVPPSRRIPACFPSSD
jgi:hypothetical protein